MASKEPADKRRRLDIEYVSCSHVVCITRSMYILAKSVAIIMRSIMPIFPILSLIFIYKICLFTI